MAIKHLVVRTQQPIREKTHYAGRSGRIDINIAPYVHTNITAVDRIFGIIIVMCIIIHDLISHIPPLVTWILSTGRINCGIAGHIHIAGGMNIDIAGAGAYQRCNSQRIALIDLLRGRLIKVNRIRLVIYRDDGSAGWYAAPLSTSPTANPATLCIFMLVTPGVNNAFRCRTANQPSQRRSANSGCRKRRSPCAGGKSTVVAALRLMVLPERAVICVPAAGREPRRHRLPSARKRTLEST